MEEILLKKLLSPLTRITPDAGYMANSKARISLRGQEIQNQPLGARFFSRVFESVTFTAGLALASLFIFIALGSLSYLAGGAPSGQVTSSFNNDSLALEAESVDFNLQISEISYFDESAKQVALALDKISGQSSNETTLSQP